MLVTEAVDKVDMVLLGGKGDLKHSIVAFGELTAVWQVSMLILLSGESTATERNEYNEFQLFQLYTVCSFGTDFFL